MATLALLIWPVLVLAVFSASHPARALIWTTMAGYLFLPQGAQITLSGLPDYDRDAAISGAALLGVLIFGNRAPPGEGPNTAISDRLVLWTMIVLAALLVIGPIFTVLTNNYPLVNGDRVRQALGVKDFINMPAAPVIRFIPLFLALRWLDTPERHRELFAALVVFGLAYSLMVLFERRMSPQLHVNLYGYFQHGWIQHLRGGGFRPIVFLDHGLSVGMFLLTAVLAAVAMLRGGTAARRPLYLLASGWLLMTLLLSRNLGAVMLAFAFLPIVAFLGIGLQARLAALIAAAFLAYPMLRQAQVIPLDQIMSISRSINESRANSLAFRLEHETALLLRAVQKPLFGWGGWGRWRIINEKGEDVTVSDGVWIIALGERGWAGYLGYFGLLCLPVVLLPRAARRRGDMNAATAGIAVMTASNLIYLIPNSTLSPIGILAAGALGGYALRPRREGSEAAKAPTPDAPRGNRYTRFGDGPPAEPERSPGPVRESPARNGPVTTRYPGTSRPTPGE